MARDNKKDSLVNNIKDMIDVLYRKTYYSSDYNKKALDSLNKQLDTSIDKIIDKNINSNGVNMSRFYSRINLKNIEDDKKIINGIEEVFNDHIIMDNVLSVYMDNKFIRDLDLEIDTICKYMPKLEEALEIKKDAVLSADSFSKEFINVKNSIHLSRDESFISNIEEIKRIYNLSDIIELAYDKASKYGEHFVYILKYDKAFDSLLNRKSSSHIKISESTIIYEDGTIEDISEYIPEEYNDYKLEVNLIKSDVVYSIVESEYNVDNKPIIDRDKLKFDDNDLVTNDGLISKKEKDVKVKVNGCILKNLRRENVIPIYIDEICLGYYYVETNENNPFEYIESIHDPISSLKKGNNILKDNEIKKEKMLKMLSSKLSKQIDTAFINRNQDITREIYLILKHNDMYNKNDEINKINVTFIPPEDMIHFYFKKDSRTNRGISDLSKSLFPAKLYACLYITNTIGVLTRSQDKRAYFVKQYVDTNISSLLLNTINQIKKSNFGMREIHNINNMFNIVGRYNDYVIPVSQNNEKPIEFEIISGQNIDTKNDLMESLESMAINPTGVPLEIIETRKTIDFSRQLTMSNGKFARHVLKRQAILQPLVSNLVSTVYNYHFNKNEKIDIILPPPSYLTINNTLDMYRSAKDLVDSIIDLEVEDTERHKPWVAEFRKNLMRHQLTTYINWDDIDNIKDISKVKSSKNNMDEYDEQ